MDARALVGAVLAPHHAEDAEFGVAGLAAQQRDDLVVLGRRELMLRDEIGCDGHCGACRRWRRSMDSKITAPFRRAHQRIAGALGMRHHAHHVAFAVQDAGDVAQRAVGIVHIAEHDAVFGFEFVERALIGEVAAFAVRHGQVQHLALCSVVGEGRVRGLGAQRHFAADELEAAIAQQRAGQQAALRPESENRCRCPAPVRRRRRTCCTARHHRREAARWRRSAGSRRRRSRRAE